MTKRELIERIYNKEKDNISLNQDGVKKAVTAMFEAIRLSILNGRRVQLRGFGSFFLSDKRSNANFRSPPEKKNMKHFNRLRFKLSSEIKKEINNV